MRISGPSTRALTNPVTASHDAEVCISASHDEEPPFPTALLNL